MSITSAAHTTRRVLTGLAVAAVAATCMVSSGVTAATSTTHQSPASSATKEWKASSSHDATNVLSATKEYRSIALGAPSTKEW
jgi:Spy/CpxP family protein refolding chaperone